MTETPFKGMKYDTIELTMTQIIDLARDGRSVVRFGTWDDGTPAFIAITSIQTPPSPLSSQPQKGRVNE